MAWSVLIIAVVILIVGCGSAQVATSAPSTPESENAGLRNADAVSDPVITLETSGVWCEPCQSLRISIYESKPATLESEQFEKSTDQTRAFDGNNPKKTLAISPLQLKELRRMLDEMNFFKLEESYVPKTGPTGRFVPSATCPQSLSDGPTFKISYRKGDRVKTVRHYDSCEPDDNVRKLPAFEKHVMELFSAYEFLRPRIDSNANTSAPNHK